MPANKTVSQVVGEVLQALQQARGTQSLPGVPPNVPADALTMRDVLQSGPKKIFPLAKQYFQRWTNTPRPAQLTIRGDDQRAPTGRAVPNPISVRVEDASDNAMPMVWVRFDVTKGGGTITGEKQRTDANGTVDLGSWILGEAGTNLLSVSVASLSAVIKATATVIAPRPAGGTGPAGSTASSTPAAAGTTGSQTPVMTTP